MCYTKNQKQGIIYKQSFIESDEMKNFVKKISDEEGRGVLVNIILYKY